jgi:phosphatidylinositol 4-kinase
MKSIIVLLYKINLEITGSFDKSNENKKIIDDFLKYRRTTIMPLAKNKSNLILDKKERNKINENEISIDTNININIKKEKKSILNENEEIEEEIEEVYQRVSNNIDPFFGELFENQTERLRSISPFGKLNSWKLFKMIVKSGEDLRQEQFATQLINEFNQIFKIEKVDCWVNPYEIISTGMNMGLIECIPNSISLDQLKRKSKITSLKNFYDLYYGPENSDSKKFLNLLKDTKKQ